MKTGLWLKLALVALLVLGYPLGMHWLLTASSWSHAALAWFSLLQNVGMQLLLALFFGLTLRPGHEPLIARFARRIHGADYSPRIARYARQATWAWARFSKAHRDEPRLAVIAYGKLGGKELGYGGDLDVVFVFDDDDENASEIYGAFVRRLITWLTLRTAAGELFDIDTALRPNGNSGLLVTSLTHFEAYQTGRGSNTAWTWEHQAITRARFCAGNAALAQRCEGVRRQVLTAPRDAQALKTEVQALSLIHI